jgi:hypothetical protein
MIGDKSSYKETPCIDSPTDSVQESIRTSAARLDSW